VIDNKQPSLQASLLSSEYEILLPADIDLQILKDQIGTLLAQDTLPVQRRKKTVDLKTLILDWSLPSDSPVTILKMYMMSSPLENGRPDEFLELLGIDPADCLVTRTKLIFEEE